MRRKHIHSLLAAFEDFYLHEEHWKHSVEQSQYPSCYQLAGDISGITWGKAYETGEPGVAADAQ